MTTFILTLLVFIVIVTVVVYLKMRNSLPASEMDVAKAEILRKAALYEQWVLDRRQQNSTLL
jgi:hypothetical protein